MFTPKNMLINCASPHFLFIVVPVKRGNQWKIPAIIAKTAPIEST
jgi:hypothetical protein